MSEKTVTYNVSGTTVTVTVTDADNYPASSATVTAKRMPNGPVIAPDLGSGVESGGQAVFKFSNLPAGQYLISVDCGGKLFSTVVDVPGTGNNVIQFHFTSTTPATDGFPVPIAPMLPTLQDLHTLRALNPRWRQVTPSQ